MADKNTTKTSRTRSVTDNPLLIEIGTEELPPKALKKLGLAFAKNIYGQLKESELLLQDITEDDAEAYQWFAAPRRLAVSINGVKKKQKDQYIEKKGPAVKAAFSQDGTPTKAALGFAASVNADVDKLDRLKTDKGEWLIFKVKQTGQTLTKILPDLIDQSLKKLPIPKRMRWGNSEVEFVRPIHWIVVLHGSKTIKLKVMGITAGNTTHGHRFHSPTPIPIKHAKDYGDTLEKQGFVVANFAKRRKLIEEQIEKLERKIDGRVVFDDALLDEVSALVESPHAILGEFEEKFLDIPKEVLISSMRDHQKYFHVMTNDGALSPNFITVSNIKSKSPSRVKKGNERVLRARLTDALFFWDTDRKSSLEAKTDGLKGLLFHKKLGSVMQKSQRMQSLCKAVARQTNTNETLSARAAGLCKIDLVSDMVGEFPELQGVMGHYYALHDREEKSVATAIEQHYLPKFAGDRLPDGGIAQAVALADKIDSLVGIFITGEEPTGDKDPYGLRRAAVGVLRICIEGCLDLDLRHLYEHAAGEYQNQSIDVDIEQINKALQFTMDRLPAYYGDKFSTDELASVAAINLSNPLDFSYRLNAVNVFQDLPEAKALAAANKRITNILKKTEVSQRCQIQDELLQEEGERTLANALVAVSSDVSPLITNAKYEQALKMMANLQQPVDAFFEQVMVMDENEQVRENRLALLSHINQLFLSIADISHLKTD